MATAQDVFKEMMRDTIKPALRQMSFRGSRSSFWLQDGDDIGTLWTQKSVHNTRHRVNLIVHLNAAHMPTDQVYWTRNLLAEIPRNRDDWWSLTANRPSAAPAVRLLNAVRKYGLPAIQAALDEPGFPPDPHAQWARRFPRLAASAERDSEFGQRLLATVSAGQVNTRCGLLVERNMP
ncbi:MAG: DUF4304 domain-containing protein [Nocardiopsaceae bacterium]|jgi:hypothetical protein|nr:DUF4304 domain-containing protein [Nocardiopsaceae bacterium]